MDKLKAKAADKKRAGGRAGDKSSMLGSSLPREEVYPHRAAGKDITDPHNDITTTEWYKWSFEIQSKLIKVQDENKKIENDIKRR